MTNARSLKRRGQPPQTLELPGLDHRSPNYATTHAVVRCVFNGMNGDAYAAGQHALTGAQEQGTGIDDAHEAGSRSGN